MSEVQSNWRAIRQRAGLSQTHVAVAAQTSPASVRLFEAAGPAGLSNAGIRQRLEALYARLDSGAQPAKQEAKVG